MKRTLILPAMLIGITCCAQLSTKEVNKYSKKFGVAPHELYYTSKKELALVYSKDGELSFPNNHVYDVNGKEVKMELRTGKKVDILSCFSAFERDVNRYINDTGDFKYAVIERDWKEEQQIFKPATDIDNGNPAQYNFVLYYLAGYPLVKKYYKGLIGQLKEYRKKGKDIDIYFVVVQ